MSGETSQCVPADSIKCCLINAQSLCNKLQELHVLLASGEFDILLFTETWFNAYI